jgi:transposase-like protein
MSYIDDSRDLYAHTGPRPNEARRQAVKALYENGMTIRAVAERVGTTYQAAHAMLQRMGVTLRKRGGRYGRSSAALAAGAFVQSLDTLPHSTLDNAASAGTEAERARRLAIVLGSPAAVDTLSAADAAAALEVLAPVVNALKARTREVR